MADGYGMQISKLSPADIITVRHTFNEPSHIQEAIITACHYWLNWLVSENYKLAHTIKKIRSHCGG